MRGNYDVWGNYDKRLKAKQQNDGGGYQNYEITYAIGGGALKHTRVYQDGGRVRNIGYKVLAY